MDKNFYNYVATGSFTFQRFAVKAGHNYYVLESDHHTDFAVLDSRSTKALQTLSDLSPIRLEAVFVGNDIISLGGQLPPKRATKSIPLYLNVYGSRQILEEVGKRLSKAHAYLQHPSFLESHITYENPHYFAVPGRPTVDQNASSEWRDQPTQSQHQGLDIINILETLDQDQGLQSEKTNPRIRTPLLE